MEIKISWSSMPPAIKKEIRTRYTLKKNMADRRNICFSLERLFPDTLFLRSGKKLADAIFLRTLTWRFFGGDDIGGKSVPTQSAR